MAAWGIEDGLAALLDQAAGLATVLGLSVLGLLTLVVRAWKGARRYVAKRQDRQDLGVDYESWRQLALAARPSEVQDGLRVLMRRERQTLRGHLFRHFESEAQDRLARAASGTYSMRYRDIFATDGLVLPTSFVTVQSAVDVPRWPFLEGLGGLRLGNRVILVGPAGAGKSFFLRSLEYHWISKGRHQNFPFVIDSQDFLEPLGPRGTLKLGSKEWLARLGERRFFNRDLDEVSLRILQDVILECTELLVDALDEISDIMDAESFEEFLSSHVIANSSVVTTRGSFFETSLKGHVGLAHYGLAVWTPNDATTLERHVLALCKAVHGHQRGVAVGKSIIELRRRELALRELTDNPLLLAMVVSIDLGTFSSEVGFHSWIYREFVLALLERDRKKRRSTLNVDLVFGALGEVAWTRFCRRSRNVGRIELRAALGATATEELVTYLEDCPLLSLYKGVGLGDGSYDVRFYHKSFGDYFVAWRLGRWLLGEYPKGVDFFLEIDTPEITFFVKEQIELLEADSVTARSARLRLREGISEALMASRSSRDDRSAKLSLFAAGQMIYYLSIMADDETKSWLRAVAVPHRDFWVSRCACIGLAFSGSTDEVQRLIEGMRRDIAIGDFTRARQNIGVELGFYGDQEFSRLNPTRDVGLGTCARLVGRCVQELEIDVEAANWRMILFNLVYLAKHRPASLESFRTEMGERRDVMLRILHRMRRDADRADAPEIEELMGVIEGLTTVPTPRFSPSPPLPQPGCHRDREL